MARSAQVVQQLVYALHAYDSVSEERGCWIFTRLQQTQIIRVKLEVVALDSTLGKVHPDGTVAKNGPQALGGFCGR